MGSAHLPGSPDRQGGKPAPSPEPWFSYACPVCGHRDGATLDVGSTHRVNCGYCDTLLELSAGSASQEKAATRVVVDDGEGGTH